MEIKFNMSLKKADKKELITWAVIIVGVITYRIIKKKKGSYQKQG